MAERSQKQKLSADGYDWVHPRSRRIHGLGARAGTGKKIKNVLARARRRKGKKETHEQDD